MHVFITLTAPDNVQAAMQANGSLGEFRELRDELEGLAQEDGKLNLPPQTRRLFYAVQSAIKDAEGHYRRPVVDVPEGEPDTPEDR
jgi:hypothetical protein